MHTSVRYNRRIRKKLSEKTDEVVGKDSIVIGEVNSVGRTTAVVRLHNS